MPRFHEIDAVEILVDRPEVGLRAGDAGVVMLVSDDEEVVTVEFVLPGDRFVLEDFRADEVRVTWSNALPSVDEAEGTSAFDGCSERKVR
jgi:hypothetical protein